MQLTGSVTTHPNLLDQARALVRGSGARSTAGRVRVLAELLDAGEALTHIEVRRRIEAVGDDLDRVTLYRVLEWLVEVGLAHRVAGADRVYRFSVRPEHDGAHGHFRCTRCERMFCMRQRSSIGRWVRAALPAGFSGENFELMVSGRCAECTVD
jgi:Fur family transcriptional regulator, ferric uptake regulator